MVGGVIPFFIKFQLYIHQENQKISVTHICDRIICRTHIHSVFVDFSVELRDESSAIYMMTHLVDLQSMGRGSFLNKMITRYKMLLIPQMEMEIAYQHNNKKIALSIR